MKRFVLGSMLAVAAALPALGAFESPTTERKAAVNRAIPLLQKAGEGYIRQRGCFSCHHQGVPIVALEAVRQHGFTVDQSALEAQVKHTVADLEGNVALYKSNQGQPGGVVRAGYSIWALAASGRKADDTTSAVSAFLAQRDAAQGFWRAGSNRPPSEASNFTSTFLALYSLEVYPPADAAKAEERRTHAREWLLANPSKETEDRVFRLWSLKLAQAQPADLAAAGKELRDTQRPDGGWAQLPDQESDAYATGSVLVALAETGQLAPADPAFQKGVAYLLKTQEPDGSWHVVSRSKPFQPYFESGFPHGKDQWISCAATAWAVWALALPDPTIAH